MEPPADTDGRSLIPLLSADPPDGRRQALLLEAYMGTGKLRWEGVRTPRYTHVEYPNGDKELFDNRADPYQLESLHRTAEPSLLEDLQDQLEALRDCSGEECRSAEDLTPGSAGG